MTGGEATLGCSFHLTGTPIYSIKWYHNGTEFYRFVPTERAHAISDQSSGDFFVTEVFRSDQRVTLSLSRLKPSASGNYLCEVMAEHPSFLKEAVAGEMTVLREPLSPPVIAGAQHSYHSSEEIEIKCHPRHASPTGYAPVLHWLLDGRQVDHELVRPLPARRPQHAPGLALHLPATQVVAAGGSVRAECRISLGPHARSHSAFTTLMVTDALHIGPHSYLSAAGLSTIFGCSWACVLLECAVIVLLDGGSVRI
ncbi:hypothetical protein O3P69_007287 [Scylla paramamosain]